MQHDVLASSVDPIVVLVAQQHAIRHRVAAAVVPLDHVVHLAPRRRTRAGLVPAVLVARHHLATA
jgi:hypothetical protein